MAVILFASCSERTEDCINDVAKNAKTDTGVVIGVRNCQTNTAEASAETSAEKNKTIPDENRIVKSLDEVSSMCYVFWDGRHWQKGKTEGDKFLRLKIGQHGVQVMVISLPIEMANEFGMSKDRPDQVDLEKGALGAFMKKHWYQLEILCNLSK